MSPGSFKRSLAPLFNAWGKRIEERELPEAPIAIGGCARSGTTMLLALLGAHPSIFAFRRELGFLTQWHRDPRQENWIPSRIDRLYRELIRKRIPREAHRWCEKSPANIRHIDKILAHYKEQVRIIHIVRDPRDVCSSEHPKPDKSGTFYVSPERWVNDVKAGWTYRDHPCVLTLRYEDLIRHHEEKIERICRFIGEEHVPEMDDWHRNTSVKDNPAWESGVKPIDEASIGKWRKEGDPDRIRAILEHPGLQDLMEELGYTPDAE